MIQNNHIDKHIVRITNIYNSTIGLYECLEIYKL